ncbi:MAG: hypothetical protein M3R02_16385 [Chloroflexota bacterium]|nr:hypothetical protein [Chloroflexota bacterium]
MGWETRGPHRYYYRARKVGGRVVKEYIGTGLSAEIAALQDRSARQDRAITAMARRAERTGLEAVDGELTDIDDAIEAATRASLILTGYHRHHRGAWRRRRDG